MQNEKIYSVGRLSIYDIRHLRDRSRIYLEQLQRSWSDQKSIFRKMDASNKTRQRMQDVYTVEIRYTELLIDKLDDLLQSLEK